MGWGKSCFLFTSCVEREILACMARLPIFGGSSRNFPTSDWGLCQIQQPFLKKVEDCCSMYSGVVFSCFYLLFKGLHLFYTLMALSPLTPILPVLCRQFSFSKYNATESFILVRVLGVFQSFQSPLEKTDQYKDVRVLLTNQSFK